MSKEFELLKKIKALSDKGVGGEKINAELLLEQLCIKYGISKEELEGEKIVTKTIRYPDNYKLFWQIYYHVVPKSKVNYDFIEKEILGYVAIIIRQTAEDFAEIMAKYNFYSDSYERQHKSLLSQLKELKEQKKFFHSAFLVKNSIYINREDEEKKEQQRILTKEEQEELDKIMKTAQFIKRENYYKQLENK